MARPSAMLTMAGGPMSPNSQRQMQQEQLTIADAMSHVGTFMRKTMSGVKQSESASRSSVRSEPGQGSLGLSRKLQFEVPAVGGTQSEPAVTPKGSGGRQAGPPAQFWQDLEGKMAQFLQKQSESEQYFQVMMQEQAALFVELQSSIQRQAQRARAADGGGKPAAGAQSAVAGSAQVVPLTEVAEGAGDEVDAEAMDSDEESNVPRVELRDYHTTHLVTLTKGSNTALCACPSIRDGFFHWIYGVCDIILGYRYFELVMGLVITLNAINIGWTIDRELRGYPVEFQDIIETCFLVIFVIEISMRIIVRGWACLCVLANLFDFVLVTITAFTQVLAPFIEPVRSGASETFFQQVMILRMMRLLRLARAVRLVATFRPLWKLAKGLTDCCTTMFSALVLMFITIYIFACFGAEFISKTHKDDPDPAVAQLIEVEFSNLPRILLTLMRFISMDSAHAFYAPLVYSNPWLMLYFMLLIVIVAIAMMNLITALLVEDAISSAKMDQEMKAVCCKEKIRHLKGPLRQLFQTLDRSKDGIIEIREVVESIRLGMDIPTELVDIINPARMMDLFEALDADHSGDLSENEFVEGMCCVAVADMPRETMQVLQLLRSLRQEIRRGLKSVNGGKRPSNLPRGASMVSAGTGLYSNGGVASTPMGSNKEGDIEI